MIVGVVDYGVGNLGSLARALQPYATPRLIDRPADISVVDRLILPGVGNFSDCALRLSRDGWRDALLEAVAGRSRPLLGICVGMQLLADTGHEGPDGPDVVGVQGLGLIPGSVQHLRVLGCKLRLPHVGWNTARLRHGSHGIFNGIPDLTDFYFVHSYAFVTKEEADILAVTDYEVPLTVAVRRQQVWGTQFHPEKSSRAGHLILKNFVSTELC